MLCCFPFTSSPSILGLLMFMMIVQSHYISVSQHDELCLPLRMFQDLELILCKTPTQSSPRLDWFAHQIPLLSTHYSKQDFIFYQSVQVRAASVNQWDPWNIVLVHILAPSSPLFPVHWFNSISWYQAEVDTRKAIFHSSSLLNSPALLLDKYPLQVCYPSHLHSLHILLFNIL